MIDLGKRNALGILVDAVDYEAAVGKIITAAKEDKAFGATALAVHGVMTGVTDRQQKYRLNHLDLVTPDGQPVRWALDFLYRTKLPDRVYGPTLTLRLCASASDLGLPVYFYGGRPRVVERLADTLSTRFPALKVAGSEPSKFRNLNPEEIEELVYRVRSSGAKMMFVGLGCPRQEAFVYELREQLSMPLLAVGAAFDYHSGEQQEPPRWIQDHGLQWAHRLWKEPGRLWKRYLATNPAFLVLLAAQAAGAWHPAPDRGVRPLRSVRYG